MDGGCTVCRMKYEIHFGDFIHWCEAANSFQACIKTLDACIEELKTFPLLPMNVINLTSGEEEIIGLEVALEFKHNAAQSVPSVFPSDKAQLDAAQEWLENLGVA